MKIGIRELKKINTYEDLKGLSIGRVICDIGGRGGNLGFAGSDVARFFEVSEYDLPKNFGCGCNYLGGGIRGSIFPSDFSDRITGRKPRLLNELALACVRVYEYCENENNMNEEEYPDGETNWNAKATKSARNNRAISAY